MGSQLILASSSPRRHEFLKMLGLDFDVIPSRVAEEFVDGELPQEHVLRLAEAKALDVAREHPDQWVIAADTIVCVNGSTLGKPKSREEALEMLQRLSGREHQVLTGFAVCHWNRKKEGRQSVRTEVRVKTLAPGEMEWYANTGEPFDKAGAYGIQGIGSFMIESICGSYTNVVGLPVCELLQLLDRLGAITISERGMRVS